MHEARYTRRQAIRSGAGALALAAVSRVLAAQAPARGELRFRLQETAGLRRFGYPVAMILPDVSMGNHFQLLRNGKPVPAQFRATDGPDGGPVVMLDFSSSLAPLASETYVVRYGGDLEPGPEPKASLHVEHEGGIYRVVHGANLRFEVPEDLGGFLRFAGNERRTYVAEGGKGLWLRSGGETLPLAGSQGEGAEKRGPRVRVVREGPFAVGLQFEGTARLQDKQNANWRLVLTFPSSKSWVEALWTVDDPTGAVGGMGLDLNLALAGSPTLVDLGANSTVYATLKENERVDLRAGKAPGEEELPAAWVVRKGAGETLEPFALAAHAEGAPPSLAEGWAHVMDSTRATALAVDRFGRDALDAIEVNGHGRVRIGRAFASGNAQPAKGTKEMRFWFHFVSMPVQVGAATSPQAMLAPLQVEWLEGGKT